MREVWKIWMSAVAIVAMVSCTQPESSEPQASAEPESQPEAEQPDPTVIDADHYSVEFENDQVRVLRVNYGPGEQSVMHTHPDHVGVFLSDQTWTMELGDGTTQEISVAAGEHVFAPAGSHLPRNAGDEAAEVVVVELKDGISEAAGEAGPDSIVVDADHYSAELENERVRVLRITYAPGEESVMHYHPDGVAVYMTDQQVVFQSPDGTSQEVTARAGDHVFAPAGPHQPKNIGEEPLELVLIELK